MRGFKNFKGSDARCPSIHFLFYDLTFNGYQEQKTLELTTLVSLLIMTIGK